MVSAAPCYYSRRRTVLTILQRIPSTDAKCRSLADLRAAYWMMSEILSVAFCILRYPFIAFWRGAAAINSTLDRLILNHNSVHLAIETRSLRSRPILSKVSRHWRCVVDVHGPCHSPRLRKWTTLQGRNRELGPFHTRMTKVGPLRSLIRYIVQSRPHSAHAYNLLIVIISVHLFSQTVNLLLQLLPQNVSAQLIFAMSELWLLLICSSHDDQQGGDEGLFHVCEAEVRCDVRDADR